MTDSTTARLAVALELIAHGSAEEKVRFIAAHDPDWFVDHVLQWSVSDVDRDEVAPPRRATDRDVLDQSIARITLAQLEADAARPRTSAGAPAAA